MYFMIRSIYVATLIMHSHERVGSIAISFTRWHEALRTDSVFARNNDIAQSFHPPSIV